MFRKFEKTARIVIPQIDVHGKLFLSDKETKLLLGGSVAIFLWQLIISRLFPERNSWFPVCPKCGSRGKSFKEIKK